MDHLTIIIVMALVALGAKFAMLQGHILGWLGELIESIPNAYVRKPLGTCERCMVSVWGTGAIMVLGMMPVAYWVGTGIVLRYGWFAREVEVPSLLWILPAYWLAAVGLQEMFDR